MPRGATDLRGLVFGCLTVRTRAANSAQGAACWEVSCTCGVEKTVRSSQLTDGGTVSCGHVARALAGDRTRTHGMTKTFEHNAWMCMRKRCTYEKHPAYSRYGGAGIMVCDRWLLFENFYADMGVCPFTKGSVDRIDNSRGYEPTNCRWLRRGDQSKNRKNVPLIDGMTLPDLAKQHGIGASTLRQRIKAKWPREKWLLAPQQLGTRN